MKDREQQALMHAIEQEKNNFMEAAQRMLIGISVDKVNHNEVAEELLLPYTTGWCSIEDMYSKIAHLRKIVDIMEQQVKDDLADKLAENPKQPITANGLTFAYKKGSVRYTFENNPAIVQAENKLKALQEISKTLRKTGQPFVADAETGELIYPAMETYNKDTFITKYE